MKKNRVLPADELVVMREGLRALLTVGMASTVVGEAESGRTR